MTDLTIKTVEKIMGVLERLVKVKITVDGLQQIESRPTLFVINHFTRAETLIVPYVIYKHTSDKVRSLADYRLFHGRLGKFLRNVGVVSTKSVVRDRTIIGDLMTGRSNWIIYPEGLMIKNKKVLNKKKIALSTPSGIGPPHTGAALLALKSEIYKKQYLAAVKSGDEEKIRWFKRWLNISDIEELSPKNIAIVPVTISYYPLRPGPNILKNLVATVFGNLPVRVQEELEIEGNLMLKKSDMNIHFGTPIDVERFAAVYSVANACLKPLVNSATGTNVVLKRIGSNFTSKFMHQVYNNIEINIDHLFCAGLCMSKHQVISREDFHRALFLTACRLRADGSYRLHRSLLDDLIELIGGDKHQPTEEIQNLAYNLRIIDNVNGQFAVNKARLDAPYNFHLIRKENPIKVIANELEPLSDVMKILGQFVNMRAAKLRSKVAEVVTKIDLDLYRRDREAYCTATICKPLSIGSPFFLNAGRGSTGIVLAHGLLSAPAEVRPLADFLYSCGFSVYGPRLRGHGTLPSNLNDVTWQSWYHSFLRGYTVVRNYCDRVVLGGFSTGGVVALLAASRIRTNVDGVFVINPPIDLGSVGARKFYAMASWNSLLSKLKIRDKNQFYIEHSPEYPDINYDRIYLNAVSELKKLMKGARRLIAKVEAPTLIIHSTGDKSVDPESSMQIYANITHQNKCIEVIDSDRHVIIRDQGSDRVFNIVAQFADRIHQGILFDSTVPASN